ncbi:MAG: hypothetical protein A3C36_03150 [Omnitrophica WOR_2 bacterium RIFCSPHIGHO2_02_FULL_52_10]|nr:MAG: hypothetical protein A3C36_03150 [Omnitrophica WOR_2 bacterium RIFCSPHIGHO2_02_FULL_52_10]
MKTMFFNILLASWIFSQGAHGQIAVAAEPALEDESSIYLVTKAWEALKNNDLEAVKALTKKGIDRYGQRALAMQKQLQGFARGNNAQIRRYWALNDVATVLFIRGKAYQTAGMYEEAVASYTQLVNEYKFGQCWDPRGWFWKPAQVAQENIAMIKKGVFFDYGDYASATLVARAWEALDKNEIDLALGYTEKCIVMYKDKAQDMQKSLKDFPKAAEEDVNAYWALNDVATAHFIKGQAYMIKGTSDAALREFEKVRNEYFFGQCWDPRGWFWKPADAARNWIEVLDEKMKTEDFLFNI